MKSTESSWHCLVQKTISGNATKSQSNSWQCEGRKSVQIDHEEDQGSGQSLSSAWSDIGKPQDSIKREGRFNVSKCSAETDPQEKKIKHSASIAVKNEAAAACRMARLHDIKSREKIVSMKVCCKGSFEWFCSMYTCPPLFENPRKLNAFYSVKKCHNVFYCFYSPGNLNTPDLWTWTQFFGPAWHNSPGSWTL